MTENADVNEPMEKSETPPYRRLASETPPYRRLASEAPPEGRLASEAPPEGRLAGETLHVAETWRRVFAYFIDQFVVCIFFAPIFSQFLSSVMHHEPMQIPWLTLFSCFSLALLYQILFLRFLGATIGKLIFGLRVVSFRNQQSLNWMQCILRTLTDHLSLFFSQALRVLALTRFDRRHVSDWVAETQVMQKTPRQVPARPRLLVAGILFLYFFISGFYSAYRLIQRSEWDSRTLTLHPASSLGESPVTGSD